MHKPNQRVILITVETLSEELQRFESKEYRFEAEKNFNDMWVVTHFGDAAFEEDVLERIHHLIGNHYSSFRRVIIQRHC